MYAKYIWYLRAAIGVEPTAIDGHLAAVKKELGERGVDVTFTDNKLPLVKMARKAAKKRTREQLKEALLRKEARMKLPFLDPLTDWVYLHFWCRVEWDWEGTALRMSCVAILVMDVFGFRESNLARPRPDSEDHTLRAEDFTIVVQGPGNRIYTVTGGSLAVHQVQAEQVIAVHMIVVSSKRSVEALRKTVSPADPRGRRLIEVLLEWLKRSGVQPTEFLCTCHRQHPRTKKAYTLSLTCEKLNLSIKVAAEENGYPPEHFASSSMRKGMVTRDRLTGVQEDETAEKGSWKSKQVMNKYYNFGRRLYRRKGDLAPLRDSEVAILLSTGAAPATQWGVGQSRPEARAVNTTQGYTGGESRSEKLGVKTFAQRLGYSASRKR